MKKLSKLFIVFLVFSVVLIPVYAERWYWAGNDKTYAENVHEGFWEDKYYATVSVQGIETKFVNGIHYYPTFSRLTYNVQGKIYVVQIDSEGPEDSVVRTKEDVIKDEWNEEEETTCHYRFGEARNFHITSVENPLW